jgi:type IV pilus assembly protein PilW
MRRAPLRAPQRGVTLIELMVGMVIGLLATVVIAQVLVVSESQRRTTVSGSDAQVNGALALYAVQRDLQMAGYGLTSAIDGLGCEIRAQRNGVNFTWRLAPVIITDGAAGAPDSLRVMSSAKTSYSVPARIVTDHPQQAANFFVNTTLGIAERDVMLAVPKTIDANNWCSVFNVTNLGGNSQIIHNQSNANGNANATPGPWNQPGGSTIFPTAGYPAGSYVVNLGQFVTRDYGIGATHTLQLASFSTAAGAASTEDLFSDIVNLQAFYGKDSDGNGVVDTYDTTTPTTRAGWQQVLGVRIAIVARSPKMEREAVTTTEPLWDVGNAASVSGAAACGSSNCVTLKVDGLPDWQRYRYKVYDSLVPLRNMLWRS